MGHPGLQLLYNPWRLPETRIVTRFNFWKGRRYTTLFPRKYRTKTQPKDTSDSALQNDRPLFEKNTVKCKQRFSVQKSGRRSMSKLQPFAFRWLFHIGYDVLAPSMVKPPHHSRSDLDRLEIIRVRRAACQGPTSLRPRFVHAVPHAIQDVKLQRRENQDPGSTMLGYQ